MVDSLAYGEVCISTMDMQGRDKFPFSLRTDLPYFGYLLEFLDFVAAIFISATLRALIFLLEDGRFVDLRMGVDLKLTFLLTFGEVCISNLDMHTKARGSQTFFMENEDFRGAGSGFK